MSFDQKYNNFKKASYAWRQKYFSPLLHLLAYLKITPNQITLFRLIFILPIAWYFYRRDLSGVLVFYVLFWVFDLFDGALARYLNEQNDRGRFLDSLVDNFLYAVLIIGLIYLQSAWPWLLAGNILLEITVQVLATVKRRNQEKSDWLIRVSPNKPYFKTIAHLALLFYFFGFNFLNPLFLLLNSWLAFAALRYLIIIEKNKL